jgi:hypothetical protein
MLLGLVDMMLLALLGLLGLFGVLLGLLSVLLSMALVGLLGAAVGCFVAKARTVRATGMSERQSSANTAAQIKRQVRV